MSDTCVSWEIEKVNNNIKLSSLDPFTIYSCAGLIKQHHCKQDKSTYQFKIDNGSVC